MRCIMASVALRLFFFCLLHLCVQCDQVPVNTAVLARMIRYFDDKLQPTGYNMLNQYSVIIRVPNQQCTDQFSLDSFLNTNEINELKDFKTNRKRRLCEVTKDSFRLAAAKPSWIWGEKLHSEYILIYPTDNTNTSPLSTILSMTKNDQCVVLYTYYSPCITTCITDTEDNVLYGLSNWLNTQTSGIKALVFQEIWPHDSTGVMEDQEEQFTKINDLVPLYRCVNYDNQMQCYKCGNAGSKQLNPNCVS